MSSFYFFEVKSITFYSRTFFRSKNMNFELDGLCNVQDFRYFAPNNITIS